MTLRFVGCSGDARGAPRDRGPLPKLPSLSTSSFVASNGNRFFGAKLGLMRQLAAKSSVIRGMNRVGWRQYSGVLRPAMVVWWQNSCGVEYWTPRPLKRGSPHLKGEEASSAWRTRGVRKRPVYSVRRRGDDGAELAWRIPGRLGMNTDGSSIARAVGSRNCLGSFGAARGGR